MIRKKIIDIKVKDDFEKIRDDVDEKYINNKILEMLKKHMFGKVDTVLIEDPYYDSDYLSTYYCFYVKKHSKFEKENVRIHFYKGEEYLGYLTLRPTIENTTIGKSYLAPKLFLQDGCHVIANSFKVHILGCEEHINSFPWMQQETDVAVCAHVAIWSILRYFGTKYPNYHNITMGNVVEELPESIDRKIPTVAVSIQKIPDIFKKMGFSPIVVSKAIVGEEIFQREMIAYIDSGIPMVGCMTEKRHAVSIIGYNTESFENIAEELDKSKKLVYNNKTIHEIIVNDDNYHPYLSLRSKDKYNPFLDDERFSSKERFIEDIDYLIVPLYDRMQFNYNSVRTSVEDFLKDNTLLDRDKKYLVKTYITSSNSLKEHATLCIKHFELRDIIIRMTMPRFVWCVDFSTIEEYKKNEVSARIIIDTTCCNKNREPWLLFHNGEYINYIDGQKWNIKDVKILPYKKFENLEVINDESNE